MKVKLILIGKITVERETWLNLDDNRTQNDNMRPSTVCNHVNC